MLSFPSLHRRADHLAHLLKALTQQAHRDLVPLLRPLVPRDGVVIDIGAHAGQFTKLFAALAPDGQVIAVEPSPYALGILRHVVKWLRLRNVTVIASGLSDRPGTLILTTPSKRSGAVGFGLASFAAPVTVNPARNDPVPVETLDALVARLGLCRIDFIKCDVEGWEMHVLRGGAAALPRWRPALLLEVVENALARAGDRPEMLWELLAPLGYRARRLDGDRAVAGFIGDGDYLFACEEAPAADACR